MKATKVARAGVSRALTVAAALSAVFFVSCTTKVVVRFDALPGDVPRYANSGFENHVPEPIEPAGGFVYLQTGIDGDVSVFGPFAVTPGKDLEITGLPAGKYEHLAFFYTPVPLVPSGEPEAANESRKKGGLKPIRVAGLPIEAANPAAFWDLTASAPVAGDLFGDSGAVALFGKTKIRPFGKRVFGARLIPLSATAFSPTVGALPTCSDSAGRVQKKFVKLDSGGAKKIYVMLSNYQGRGITYVGTVSLYGGDGSILETKNFNHHIPEDLPDAVLFNLPENGAAWLYVEYIAAGESSMNLFYYQ
jgi:hypothetical protein